MKEVTRETYVNWYENMLFWRKFEDKLASVYIQQKVRGFLHLYNGQEAILAGSLHAMDLSKDRMITAYRNHVQPIGMGVDPKKVMAELLAKLRVPRKDLEGLCTFSPKNTVFTVGMVLWEGKFHWVPEWRLETNITAAML